MTDYHCHILPGVDDGFRTMENSLHCLDSYEQAGIAEVWLTPHIMEDIPNTTAALRERFEALQQAYKGPVKLHLAAENMMDELFEERLATGDVLPLCGENLLVETSYFNAPNRMDAILADVRYKGFTPVLAHPERYVYMEKDEYLRLRSQGVKFQLNLASLTGHYGPDAKRKAEQLLKLGCYSYVGTDLHRERTFDELRCADINKNIFDLLCQISY